MIRYKIDVLELLKKHGYNQTRIQKEQLLSGQTNSNLRTGKMVNLDTINKICVMCRCQPGDILEVIPTDEEKIKFF